MAELIRVGLKAKLAINNAIVKPIPAKKPPANNNNQLKFAGREAIPVNTTIQLKISTPIGLPSVNPKKTAKVMEFPKSVKFINIPALAKAKSGIITNPTHGCNNASNRSTGDSASRAAASAVRNAIR